jgi:hypothetical protein
MNVTFLQYLRDEKYTFPISIHVNIFMMFLHIQKKPAGTYMALVLYFVLSMEHILVE